MFLLLLFLFSKEKDGAREILTKVKKELFLDYDMIGVRVREGGAKVFILQISSSF